MNDWGWVKMQDQYQSWLNSPYSGRSDAAFQTDQATTCQDCHMKPVQTKDPSRSDSGTIRNHAFAAANTFIPKATGEPEHLEAVRDFLMSNKMRVTLDIADNRMAAQSDMHLREDLRSNQNCPEYYYLDQQLEADILVSNIGVGHKFPAGTNDINQAWISVQVTDASGATVYSSGAIDEQGKVDPDAYFYRSIKVDRHGREVWKHDLFNMVGEHYQNVVKAGETDSIPLSFEIPAWTTSPLTISAQLKYRKLNQRYTSWVMKDPDFRVPVVVMAKAARTIPIRERAPTEPSPDNPSESQEPKT